MYVLVIVQMDAEGKCSTLGGFNSVLNIDKNISNESATVISKYYTNSTNNKIVFPSE